ncbi:hypothetical protein L210DRAFT_3536113 [Boletus edulis BED1]|uniref:Uncharacterized protein n=1 Tax=Boletus edulis BED1 TaxID=1328754 RepID=A0AAD4GGB3_BOLED|nr:hypothetical protein L210DRAFT_3536113 [Boletus edulis BED1]
MTAVVMILRVWAMYGRSKLVLGVLLASFFLEIVSLVLTAAIQSDPRNLSAATIHILDFTGCTVDPTSFIWGKINSVLQITHGTAMLAFAIVKFAQQSLETYRLTRQWHLNRYISMLVKQGIFYFFAVFMFNLINELAAAGILQNYGWQLIVTIILQYVPVFTLTPRFIMGIRELYAHDTGVRCSGGIDTGFGLQSYSRDADGTVMVFAGVGQDEGSGDVEEIQREIGTTLPM